MTTRPRRTTKPTGRGRARAADAAPPALDDSRPGKEPAPAAGARSAGKPLAADQVPAYEGRAKTADAPAPGRRSGGAEKEPFTGPVRPRRPSGAARQPDRPDQQPRTADGGRAAEEPSGAGGGASGPPDPARTGVGAAQEGYVRMRIRVSGDRLTVLDSHLVEGPLAQAQGFSGPNAYDVTLGDRLLHAGSLPDLGTQRSFVNPGGPPEQRGHHLRERDTFEFSARVPAAELTRETLASVAVRLHRVKEGVRADRLGPAPLDQQFRREVRPVAELVGLPDSVLPEAIEERGGRTPTL
ncbi:MAG TPA: hypothetical protein VES95_04685 [Dermatophilaceae bacterium]|nr:hypothetical protein [Dermatophilaceae bacterium]